MITSIVLGEIDKNRQFMQESLRQQEVLNVATMAVQTGQNHLKMNGIEVEIIKKMERSMFMRRKRKYYMLKRLV